jgi:hypothetical protein
MLEKLLMEEPISLLIPSKSVYTFFSFKMLISLGINFTTAIFRVCEFEGGSCEVISYFDYSTYSGKTFDVYEF